MPLPLYPFHGLWPSRSVSHVNQEEGEKTFAEAGMIISRTNKASERGSVEDAPRRGSHLFEIS